MSEGSNKTLGGSTSQGATRLSREGAIATITFDRPEARNAMTWEMYGQLAAHCEALARDREIRVVVFRGAGGQAFVAGTDIAQFLAFRSGDYGGDDGVAYEQRIDQGIQLIEQLPMPTIAVIEGWAVGGGLAIATACDFRIATPEAKFAVPIARTLGNTLSAANIARLQAAWGQQRVRRMLLLAESLRAEEALACGYLHAVCADAELDAARDALCQSLSQLAPVTQAVSKEILRRLTSNDLPDVDDLIRQCYGSADFREGVAAFTERRKPTWRGN
ncbi:enoyl-CoA hydratase/isomerase family protein [Roseateles chitinivorans]|uniref:enoyl-CoA hydratase/isomerase family protein n=1 Tax=Roseateles chitinivorans TaxID=2917965 RepID=UPI003D672937